MVMMRCFPIGAAHLGPKSIADKEHKVSCTFDYEGEILNRQAAKGAMNKKSFAPLPPGAFAF